MGENNIRYGLLDTLRGIALINMLIYHALWDMVYIFGENLSWYTSAYARIWQQSICISFIFISGFCTALSRNSIKRGLTVLLCGVIISLFTNIFMPENRIYFGVLVCIGSCMIISHFLQMPYGKIDSIAGIIISFMLFIFFRNINNGFFMGAELPSFLYKGFIMSYIGFPENMYRGVDYFPLLPWFFLFCTGLFTYRAFKKLNLLKYMEKGIKPLSLIGRHTLVIYMIHQPVIYFALKVLY